MDMEELILGSDNEECLTYGVRGYQCEPEWLEEELREGEAQAVTASPQCSDSPDRPIIPPNTGLCNIHPTSEGFPIQILLKVWLRSVGFLTKLLEVTLITSRVTC